ncbi:MAG: TolC family protein [candidate division WOR-3 bacterium]
MYVANTIFIILSILKVDTIRVGFRNLEEIAEAYSPTLKEIKYNINASYTNLTGNILNFVGGAEFYLTKSEVTYSNPPIPSSTYNPSYSFTLKFASNLFSTNNLFKTISGYYESRTSIYNYEDIKRQFLINLKTQYLNTIKLKKLMEAYEKAFERNKIYYELVSERYKLGMVSKIDYLKAEIELKNAEINLLNASNNYKKSKEILLSYLGLLHKDQMVIIEDYDAPESVYIPKDEQEFLNLARKFNPSLKNARTLLNSARSGLIYSITSITPQISFEKYWNYTGREKPHSLNSFNEKEMWNVQVYVNFLNFPISILNRAQLERAYTYRYKKVLFETLAKIENSYEDLKYNYQTLELAKLRYEQAQSAYELAKEQYKSGLISIIQLMDTEASLLQSEVGLIEAKYNLVISKENLNYLIGTEVIK